MKIQEGKMPYKGFETYYRIVNPEGKKTPLLLLHGGPGSTHNEFEVLDFLAESDDRPLIMYDQIGCGLSMVKDHPELFTAETWIGELIALRQHLQLENIHLLGHSWGGMLAIWYAIEHQPQRIKSYILSSTLSSTSLWAKEQRRRLKDLPVEMQEAIAEAEKTNNYSLKEYKIAVAEFMRRHHMKDITEDSPECLKRPRVFGKEAYKIGWGPNEFTPVGTLGGYEFTARLHEIKQPALIISGQRDLCSPLIAKTMADRLPHCKWELFADCRHVPFIEETEEYTKLIRSWMNEHDSVSK